MPEIDFSKIDWFTVGLIALAAVAIIFMFRSSRRRRQQEQDMRSQIQPGAEVMTQGGFYGTLISIDPEKNEAIIETTPGTRLRVHSQIIARVVEPQEPVAEEETPAEPEGPQVIPPLDEDPKYGERTTKPRTPRKKSGE